MRLLKGRRGFHFSLTVLATFLITALPSLAAKRVALVVGNGGYVHVTHLDNPTNDAQDVAGALKELGFEVIPGIDIDKHTFDDKLHQFSQAMAGADVALFFYAGHGLQAKGINRLIPIDATIADEYGLDLETITLDSVLKQMEQAKTKIVILDACRNNPFARSLARSMGTRGVTENLGLAITVPSGTGTFIAYSTQPGNVASDGTGRNSPFTGPFKLHILDPGVSLTDVMILVRNEVVTATNGVQVPWDDSALMGKVYFKEGPAPTPIPESKSGEAAEAWSWIRNTTDLSILQEFVRRYGDTSFGAQAKQRLDEMRRQAAAQTQVIPNIKAVSLSPTKPSYDCKVHYKDAEVTICNNPELSILDNELDRLYSRTAKKSNPTQKQALLSEQRRWLELRDACSTDVRCLENQYRTRIASFGTSSLPDDKAATRTFRPSFDCNTNFLPAEVAVCNNTELAQLDVELDKVYSQTAHRSTQGRRNQLLVEQRQWIHDRDTCGSDPACIRLQYQARLGQLQDRK
jgi:uncharacterized caspase-like protein/uncharacterized protein